MTDHSSALQQLANTELQPIIQELYARRNRLRTRIIVSTLVIGLLAMTLGLVLINFLGEFGFFIVLVASVGGWFWYNSSEISAYKAKFKVEVMPRLISIVDPSRTYDPNRGISQSAFLASGIYRQGIDRYSYEDYFTGSVGETAFSFSEVHAEYKTESTDSKGNRQTQWHTIFKGLFFIADFNKNFQGETYLLPDRVEGWGGFGRWLQEVGSKMDSRPGELVKLEDLEFEKLFKVYSTDQIEARYILSTSLMQRLTAFRKQVNSDIAISFVNSNINIAISSNRDRFEPPGIFWGPGMLTLEMLEEHLRDIKLAEAVVQELNLNLRIWTKQ